VEGCEFNPLENFHINEVPEDVMLNSGALPLYRFYALDDGYFFVLQFL